MGKVRVLALASALAFGCGGGGSPVRVASSGAGSPAVIVSPIAAAVPIGGVVDLEATAVAHAGALVQGAGVAWTSSDPSVAAVSGEGAVTALRPGSATITAGTGDATGSALVCPYRPGFVSRCGPELQLDGEPFYFGGANDMVLLHASVADVDARLATASAIGARVLRLYANGEVASPPAEPGALTDWASFYYQSWDVAAGAPRVNAGTTGLAVLDHAIARAGALGLKLIVNLVDNWPWDGGADRYNRWYGNTHHDDFFTDPRTRAAYRGWVQTVLSRVNPETGIAYRDDPAIAVWELINEPHCYGDLAAGLPSSDFCTSDVIEGWAAEMSAFVKQLDPNHLVALGDIGYFPPGAKGDGSYPYVGGDVTADPRHVARIPGIDVLTVHTYPDDWLSSAPPAGGFLAWGIRWIEDHMDPAVTNGKPVLYEEIGVKEHASYDALYPPWLHAIHRVGGAGFAFYQLTAPGMPVFETWMPASERWQIEYPSAVGELLAGEIRRLNWGGGLFPAPLLSAGKGAFGSEGTSGASAVVDGLRGPGAPRWDAGRPSAERPAWIAIDVGAGAARALLAWSAPPGAGAPVDYRVETSGDSSNGGDGTWRTVATVTGNASGAREHAFELTGQSWVRIVVTAGPPDSPVQLDEIELHDASRGARDTWIFLGGSAVAAGLVADAARGPSFAAIVHGRHPEHDPVAMAAGVAGETSGAALGRIDALLAAHPDVRYWALQYGAEEADAAALRANLQALVARIRAAKRVPILAGVPPRPGGATPQALNDAVAAVTTANHLVPGPDLLGWFGAHPDQLAPDGVHLTDAGYAALHQLWADAAEAVYPQP